MSNRVVPIIICVLYVTITSGFAQKTQPTELRTKESLNQWWKFYPILSAEGKTHIEPSALPAMAMFKDSILVPGSWTAGGSDEPDPKVPWKAWRINDSYGYPLVWDKTNSAWYYREFSTERIQDNRRYFLYFGGILREGYVYLNGQLIGHCVNGIMPNEWDVTAAIKSGVNKLHVFVTDYRRNSAGKTFTPTGADQVTVQKGIWQDVYLISRPEVYVDDVTIRTSTRKNLLTVICSIRNSSSKVRKIKPQFSVSEAENTYLKFTGEEITLKPGEVKSIEISKSWRSYLAWSPNTPQLYFLQTRLRDQNSVVDEQSERFGFREVWTEGPHVMLNGTPIHMFGEWGHKMNLENFRVEYLRQWFRMLKACNMNYIRTHTFPHPKSVMELADEMGILVSLESGWFFGNSFALDDEQLWQGALQHVRDIVHTYKNYPSIILYSVGNEVRWSGNQPAIIKNTPRLRALYEQLDSTRIPYHDGDSPLWDEREQHLMSRHYGLESTGEGWWDKSKPLHIGEVGKWHYGQPIDNTIWGNDKMFASFAETHKTIALETADMAEQARSNEVACFFPWNLSCLDNFRPWPEERKFVWPDPSAPGIKPLRSGPFSSEFTWWQPDGKGYVPGVSFEIMKHAFRPVAVVVREKLNRAFDNDSIKHTVTVINDGGQTLAANLIVRVKCKEKVVWSKRTPVSLVNGYVVKFELFIPAIAVSETTEMAIETSLQNAAEVFDSSVRNVKIVPASVKSEKIVSAPITILGNGKISSLLKRSGHQLVFVDNLAGITVVKNPILLVEKDAILLGSRQNKELQKYLVEGGKVLVLEQTASPMPMVNMGLKPVEKCHLANGSDAVLKGMTADDFSFWGNDPYGVNNSDSWVTTRPYYKPEGGNFRMLLYSGFGDFGNGGFYMSPLFEVREGKGMMVACQLRLSEKAEMHPSAFGVLSNLLTYVAQWKLPATETCAVVGADASRVAAKYQLQQGNLPQSNVIIAKADQLLPSKELAKVKAKVEAGSKLIIYQSDSVTVPQLAKTFGISLEAVNLGPIYNLVIEKSDVLSEGITNHELYWLDKGQYSPAENKNRVITNWLLRSTQGVELLTSEQNSCWREFHTLNGRSERTRMPVVTYYLWNGPRSSAAGMIKMPYGKGELIFCQLPVLEESYSKADIVWSTLFTNLNLTSGHSLFQGESIKASGQRSNGHPVKLFYLDDPSDETVKRAMAVSKQSEMRLPNQAMESGFPWKEVAQTEGNFALAGNAKRYLLFYQVNAGRPRKESYDKQEGLPDPSQQTLLDVGGSGKITLTVSGKTFDAVDFGAEKMAKMADIDLEMDWNTILMEWVPDAHKSIRFDWRNRQNQPEVEFEFK